MKQIRNVMFVVLVGLVVFAHEKGLLADVSSLCGNWSGYCDCNITNNYQWSITCDFSESEAPLEVAQEFCLDAWDTCDVACNSSGFMNAKIAECLQSSPPDPGICVSDCFFTYANPNSCSFAEESSAECSCAAFNWCIS